MRLGNTIRGGACGQSGSDVVLVGESAENLSAVDPVLGEVDRLWWLSLGLSWCELAEGAARPVAVVVIDVLAEDQPEMTFTRDQHPVQALAASAADPSFRDHVARGS